MRGIFATKVINKLLCFALDVAVWSVAAPLFVAIYGAEQVIVIGCDGIDPVAFGAPEIPVMRRLMKPGAYTLKACAVMPTFKR